MAAQSIAEDIRLEYEQLYGQPRTEWVEAGRVRDFLLAMDEPVDVGPGDVVPALFVLTFGRIRRPQPSRGTAVNAGSDFEFHAPLHVGDTVSIRRVVQSVEEKQGKYGRMFLIRSEATYTNQHGELVARAHLRGMRWGV